MFGVLLLNLACMVIMMLWYWWQRGLLVRIVDDSGRGNGVRGGGAGAGIGVGTGATGTGVRRSARTIRYNLWLFLVRHIDVGERRILRHWKIGQTEELFNLLTFSQANLQVL